MCNGESKHSFAHPETIGLVTVLYNSFSVLPDFFKSLALNNNVHLDLIVISNDQDPKSIELAYRLAETTGIQATIIENNENVGVAEANNQGIRLCIERNYKFILLANNDIDFGPNVISGVRDALVSGYDAVSPLITHYDHPETIWFGGGSISQYLGRTEHHGYLKKIKNNDQKVRQTGYAPTCFLMIRRSVIDLIGFMDSRYFVYYDDSDFIYRFKRIGLKLGYAPMHQVRHKVSTSTGGARSDFTIYYTHRNRVFFIRKNIKFPYKVIALTYFFSTIVMRAPLMDRKRASLVAKAVYKGLVMRL